MGSEIAVKTSLSSSYFATVEAKNVTGYSIYAKGALYERLGSLSARSGQQKLRHGQPKFCQNRSFVDKRYFLVCFSNNVGILQTTNYGTATYNSDIRPGEVDVKRQNWHPQSFGRRWAVTEFSKSRHF